MGVTRTVIKAGSGNTPTRGAHITVHCTGYVKGIDEASNKKFWSTKDVGQTTFSFNVGLGKVIKGWDEGFMMMQVGEQARLECTSDYGYGESGFPAWGIPGNATLIFDVEIISMQ